MDQKKAKIGDTILVVRLEAERAESRLLVLEQRGWEVEDIRMGPKKLPETVNGDHPIPSLVASFVKELRSAHRKQPIIVAITCPGIIDSSNKTIMKSSRLKVLAPLPCSEVLSKNWGIQACVLNDSLCMAHAELRNSSNGSMPSDAVYVAVGQGVGATMFIAGKQYLGAGVGGHIGRMVINSSGPMHPRFHQRGTLEAYTSHEGIIDHLRGECRNDFEKTPSAEYRATPYFRFRQILQSVSSSLEVTTEQLAEALIAGDPLVLEAVDEAARYLGQCLSYIILTLNPPLLVVGGELIDGIPGYFEKSVAATKRFSSVLAWEKTELAKASLGIQAQFIGAAQLAEFCV